MLKMDGLLDGETPRETYIKPKEETKKTRQEDSAEKSGLLRYDTPRNNKLITCGCFHW